MNERRHPGGFLCDAGEGHLLASEPLKVSSRTKTGSGRRARIGALTVNDASHLPRDQKERHGTT